MPSHPHDATRRASLRQLTGMCAAAMLGPLAQVARAQSYPGRPIRIIVPNTASSLVDTIIRLVAPDAGAELGGTFVVENRSGAGGGIGADAAAKASPDGYTLLAGDLGNMTLVPALYAGRIAYDPVKDFAPVALLATTAYVLVVSPSLGVKTLDDFVKLARTKPGALNYASGGNGHVQHMLGELFQQHAKVKLYHIPYKGGPSALQAVLAGDAVANIVGPNDSLPHIESGKLVPLAIGGSVSHPLLKDLPNLAKVYPGFDYVPWFGVYAPANTPSEILKSLEKAFTAAAAKPEMRARLAQRGIAAAPGGMAALHELTARDYARNQDLVKRLGIRVE